MNIPSYMNSQQLAQLRIQPLPCAAYPPSPEPAVDSDMAHTPLEDESLDAADFSLSLMGRNWPDYLSQTHRTLQLFGLLIVAEPEKR
jgi:hypothetical protein